ncbi:restriction endonuclease [Apilactobacillus timberlakei]|uniref:restriction endonuclease n=1 Tax=Apilactobacillus timberlakei TaxID=2008380 RepID=UPI001126B471|nr:restriction endonuclease [Apilactobacillus timberlakei]TPR18084.1 hypothetical protein DYZ95_01945 [Apilactobacillus timberlakei]
MKTWNTIRRCLYILIAISMITGISEFKTSELNTWITQILSIFTSLVLIYIIMPSREKSLLKTIYFNLTGRKAFIFKVKYNQHKNIQYDPSSIKMNREIFYQQSNKYNKQIEQMKIQKNSLEETIDSMTAYKQKLSQQVNEINKIYQDLSYLRNEKTDIFKEIDELKQKREHLKEKTSSHQYNEFLQYQAKNRLKEIDGFDGYQFENITCQLLKKLGFQDVKLTKGSSDYGIDVLAKNGETTYGFQCKLYSSPVGIKAVQEVSSGIEYYKCKKAIVISNSYFTPHAISASKELNVDLWNRDKLLDLLTEIIE